MSQEPSDVKDGYQVVCYPDPILRKKAKLVTEIDDEVRQRAQEMMDIMYDAIGVGLAGPQVGWGARVVTLNTTGQPEDGGLFINPRIVKSAGEVCDDEGCLSLPGIRAKIVRAAAVEVEAYGLDGEELHIEADGLLARAWQHEIDHLDGVLIIDRMAPAARLMWRRRLKELEEDYERVAAAQ